MAEWKKQLPMLATHSRVLAGLLLILLFETPLSSQVLAWSASILFILASITDWLDGYWARKFNAVSSMGQLMDPVADKILVLAALLLLMKEGKIGPLLPFLLLARDLFVGGLRSVAATEQMVIAAKPFGKWKTGFQMVAIPCLFVGDFANLPLTLLGFYGLWFSLILSVGSGAQYVLAYTQTRSRMQNRG